jgi:hypothetical protein
MIDAKQIPDEVVEALCNHVGPVMTRADWRAAIAAGLEAWPNARLDYWAHYDGALLLPLPKDAADE